MYDTAYIYVRKVGTSSQKSYTYEQIFLKCQDVAGCFRAAQHLKTADLPLSICFYKIPGGQKAAAQLSWILIWKRARKNLDDTVGFGWIKR
jgi:hypothetical protein